MVRAERGRRSRPCRGYGVDLSSAAAPPRRRRRPAERRSAGVLAPASRVPTARRRSPGRGAPSNVARKIPLAGARPAARDRRPAWRRPRRPEPVRRHREPLAHAGDGLARADRRRRPERRRVGGARRDGSAHVGEVPPVLVRPRLCAGRVPKRGRVDGRRLCLYHAGWISRAETRTGGGSVSRYRHARGRSTSWPRPRPRSPRWLLPVSLWTGWLPRRPRLSQRGRAVETSRRRGPLRGHRRGGPEARRGRRARRGARPAARRGAADAVAARADGPGASAPAGSRRIRTRVLHAPRARVRRSHVRRRDAAARLRRAGAGRRRGRVCVLVAPEPRAGRIARARARGRRRESLIKTTKYFKITSPAPPPPRSSLVASRRSTLVSWRPGAPPTRPAPARSR